jgi:methyltransferase (TIGR00027 family)
LELPLKASRTKQSVGRTALGTATCRLIEQYQPESRRLFTDPVAKEMVGAVIRFLMRFASMRNFTVKQTDASTPGIFGAQICRTRYIDDAVEQALAQGIVQVVILGAGLDTRPYRLRGMEGVRAFEVDLPAVQKDKMKKVQSFLGKLPERVSFIPIDFDTQILEEVFAGTAFDPSRPAVFVWEGVRGSGAPDAGIHRKIGAGKRDRVYLRSEKHHRGALGDPRDGEIDGSCGEK